jgi:hypothetical protein
LLHGHLPSAIVRSRNVARSHFNVRQIVLW